MDLVQLQRKLMAAARANPPSAQVPYAFEKRIMARLAASRPDDAWALWGAALWRGALSCILGVTLLSGLSLLTPDFDSEPVTLSQLYDSEVYAAAEQLNDSW